MINIKVETGDKDTRTGSGNAYFIASHNHNGLSSEEFFCYDTGETTQEVVAAVDDPCCRKHHGERILVREAAVHVLPGVKASSVEST